VSVRRTKSNIIVSVSDTGRGISADFLPHIFEHFRQADMSSTRLSGGLGLGLAISHRLVQLHGGLLKAHSPGPDMGSTFEVILPAVSQDPPR
jgi:signal transduction histidine kinase